MARKRRPFEVFSMSFLDCMSCGFGAVILFFMIINAQVRVDTPPDETNVMSETTRLEREILEGRKNLVLAKNTIEVLDDQKRTAEGQIEQVLALIEELKLELSRYDKDTVAQIEAVERLQSDIKSLEEEVARLIKAAEEEQDEGTKIRTFDEDGQGARQYLTGLKLDGQRTLILVDRSASMLDDTIVNIIRRRNMSDQEKLRSVKWRQAVSSVDWLTAQIRPGTEFQIYMYNNKLEPAIKGSRGTWLKADEGTLLDEAVDTLRKTIPSEGTNLLGAFEAARELDPRPDNIILLADGLPTMDAETTNRTTITGRQRLNLFRDAIRSIPGGVPVNVFLYPMEGDYEAPIAYWALSFETGGSMISVSRDWP